MSLAISAASFDSNEETNYNFSNNNNNNNNNSINNKRQINHSKTQKRISNVNTEFNSEKVNSVLKSIHNKIANDNDEQLGDYSLFGKEGFTPPPPPTSMGAEAKRTKDNSNVYNDYNLPEPAPLEQDSVNNLNDAFMDSTQVQDYYKKLAPTYKHKQTPVQTKKTNEMYQYPEFVDNQEVLTTKLNYIINLLEEQQDNRTNNVTEEVVLYSFLGIFIIFLADSFARVGKYVR